MGTCFFIKIKRYPCGCLSQETQEVYICSSSGQESIYVNGCFGWIHHRQRKTAWHSFKAQCSKPCRTTVFKRSHGELVGIIGTHQIHWINRTVSIGYWLGEGYQGKGIMTKACKAVIQYLFEECGLHRIEIRAAVDNQKSRRIAERLSFSLEGILRQCESCSLNI